ncbi:MAG: DUF790 family protein [Phycisphaerae bacterium]|nr:DUF790 family protein [Phycisphaerae bacterium]
MRQARPVVSPALIREGEILHERQRTFVPDFTFRHEDGTEVLLEIVGFWTPEYLAHRRRTLQLLRHHQILIALPEKSIRDGAHRRKRAGLQDGVKAWAADGNARKNMDRKLDESMMQHCGEKMQPEFTFAAYSVQCPPATISRTCESFLHGRSHSMYKRRRSAISFP